MRWQELQEVKASIFKRLTGVKRETFEAMVSEVGKFYEASTHIKGGMKRGRKPELVIEDKILMMLMYYREYRPYLHISAQYGISESQCFKIIQNIEKILISSSLFHLPGKKVLRSTVSYQVVVVDVAESPIERPKKNSDVIIQGRKSGTRLRVSLL